jgi:TM2 domain-containing membrane protein YozV
MTYDPHQGQNPSRRPYQGHWPPPQQQPQYPPQQPQSQQPPQQAWPPRNQVQPYADQWPPLQRHQQPPQYRQPHPPQQWQSPYAPPGMTVAPKSPGVALLISFFLPGVGSMYAGSAGLGVIILILWLISLVTVFVVIGWFLAPACWIWGMIAAHMNAQRWNRERGIIS